MSIAGRGCPYVGLIPFSVDDWPFFFGRDADREIITANLQAARLTLFYGPSGVGKSSVLRAGVEHHVREQCRLDIRTRRRPEFVIVEFSNWRDDPLAGLARAVQQAVAEVLPDQAAAVEWLPGSARVSDLRSARVSDPAETADRRSPGDQETCGQPGVSVGRPATTPDDGSVGRPATTLVDLLQAWTECTGADLLLVLDQFEEYFLYHGSEDGEGTFAVEFPRAVNCPDLRTNFLISIREDSLAKLDRFKGRIPRLFDNYLRIDHLDREAAREAVVRPLEKFNELQKLSAASAADGAESSSGLPTRSVGSGEPTYGEVEIDSDLVDAVLNDVQTDKAWIGRRGRGKADAEESAPAAEQRIETPFLQLVLTRLWDEERRQGAFRLRHATYAALGGAERIVRTHLDRQMSALSWREKAIAAQVFDRLVTPSGTKIAMTADELALKAHVPTAQVGSVLDKLCSSGSRILRATAAPGGDEQAIRYEIFHDVLASALLDWLQRFEERRKLRRWATGGAVGALLLVIVLALANWGWHTFEAHNRAPTVVNQLFVAGPSEFIRLVNQEVAQCGAPAIALLEEEVSKPLDPNPDAQQRVARGKKRADAGIALMLLGQSDIASRTLIVKEDPESLTQFVHRCKERGTQAAALWDALKSAREVPARYGLLLALGEFSRDEMLAEGGSQWLETLSDWYASDPGSAIHSACGWLLRQWGEAKRLEAVDRKSLPYDPAREWFVDEVKYDDGAEPKAEYFTFIVFPAGQFQMGSPQSESGRNNDEPLHAVRLPEGFALCDREITGAQLMRWPDALKGAADRVKQRREANAAKDRADHPALYVSWYNAVEYCRWLTEKAGRTQYYVPAKKADAAGAVEKPSWPAWDFDPKSDGFRLLTEAEWEYACRAGTAMPFSCGSDENLLNRYARFDQGVGYQTIPTAACASLRPNLRGLFDMHGNVWEWCNSWYNEDPLGSADPHFVGSARVLRGGCWSSNAVRLRSAYRDDLHPASTENITGVRAARALRKP